jgi:hypothetical protein
MIINKLGRVRKVHLEIVQQPNQATCSAPVRSIDDSMDRVVGVETMPK